MKTVGPDCPADELLDNLFTGKLNIEDANRVLAHLSKCDGCAARMDGLSFEDDSLIHSGAITSATATLEHEFRIAVDRIRQLRRTQQQRPRTGPNATKELLSTDRYAVSSLHATGGVGEVWLANDSAIGRDVAFKTLRESSGDSPEAIARFLTEARITGQLEHPGIVPVYDVGDQEQNPFYTMRFVRGRTLAEAATAFAQDRRQGSADAMKLRELVNAVVGVANAVAYAHSRGVIHRDLKGKNVVLGDYGEVIVLDWGLARVLGAPDYHGSSSEQVVPVSGSGSTTETENGRVIGTPSFMAPEQARGDRDLMNEQTDVYGVGAVLYQCLTGEAPFGTCDAMEILQRVMEEPAPAPHTHWPEVPKALEAICQKAMAHKQQDRYASPGDVATDLQRWLADEPVEAHRDPLTHRLARFARKNRSLVAGGMALALTAIVALGASTLLISREQEKTLAAQQRAEQNFKWASATVDSLISKVNDPGLREIPYLAKFRMRALEDALAFNEQFLGPSSVPTVRLQAGEANHRIAALYSDMDMPIEAIDAASEAVAALEALRDDEPELPRIKVSLAKACSGLATRLHQLKRLDEGLAACDDAIAAIGSKDVGADTVEGQVYLSSLCLKGEILLDQGRLADAEACLQQAMSVIASSQGQSSQEILARANVHETLAGLLRKTKRVAEAGSHSRQAIAELERALLDAPDDQAVLTRLSGTLTSYANQLTSTGNRKESEQYWKRSIEVHERMVAEYPYVPTYQHNLTSAYLGFAVHKAEGGSLGEAEQMFRDGLESAIKQRDTFHSTPTRRFQVASSRRLVAVHLMNMTKNAEAMPMMREAAAEFEDLAEDFPDVQDYRYRTATTLFNLSIIEGRLPSFKENSLNTIQRATAMLEQLCEDAPSVPNYAHRLGAAYRVAADLHLRTGAEPEALVCFQKSINVHRRIASTAPDKPKHARQLGIALYKLAEHQLGAGRIEAAQESMTESLAIRQTLLEEQPDWFYARMDLVLAYDVMGKIFRAKEDPKQANEHFAKGAAVAKIAIDQGLHGTSPKREYGALKQSIAQLHIDSGEFDEALEALKEPIEVFQAIRIDRPDKYEYVYLLRECIADRAKAEVGLGNRLKAMESVQEMLSIEPLHDWEDHQAAADIYVRCAELVSSDESLDEPKRTAEKKALHQQAADQVRIAIKKGYEGFAEDEAFEAVRGLDAFKEFTAESAAP